NPTRRAARVDRQPRSPALDARAELHLPHGPRLHRPHLHGHDFSLEGEWRAAMVHSGTMEDEMAKRALAVEVYGQASSAVANAGVFPPQKVFLPDDGIMQLLTLPPVGERVANREPGLLKSIFERAPEIGPPW